MNINDKYFISKRREDMAITTNLLTGGYGRVYDTTDPNYYNLNKILQICRKRSMYYSNKNRYISKFLNTLVPTFSDEDIKERLFNNAVAPATTTPETKSTTTSDYNCKQVAEDIANKIIKFFSEFNVTASIRFINTLFRVEDKIEYTINYFNLQNHPFTKEVSEKVKSYEFKNICNQMNELAKHSTPKAVNSRLTLYFGEPGTGKTTEAIAQAETCIVCSSDMLPVDLMQNFAFSDGKAEFQKSDLWIAMEDGKTIVMDEINMLPFESLRFLQGLLDNKPSIDFKGFHIDIHPDFKVIGTMNLNVSGQAIPLPHALVDRCADIKEYKMNAQFLAKALLA